MPTLPLPEAKDRVAQYLATLGDAARGARVVGLTGDASDRKYYRVLPNDGDPFVLAVHASAIDGETLPFVNVGRLFEAMPVPTPRLLGYDNALGILSLQDLGDVTLQAHLGTKPFQAHAALYRQAVAHIVTMQTRGAALTSPAAVSRRSTRQRKSSRAPASMASGTSVTSIDRLALIGQPVPQ